TCLQRRRCHSSTSEVAVGRCGHCGAQDWALDGEGRLSQDGGRNCLTRSGEEASMQHCANGWTRLVL
ncbi:unnamed protein product, partial [Phaeothamnion confervicola]